MADKKIEVLISGDASSLVSSAKEASSELKKLSATKVSDAGLNEVSRAAGKASAALKGTGKSAVSGMGEVKKSSSEAEKALVSLSKTLSLVKKATIGAFTIGTIKDFVSSALQASASVELLKKGLSFNLGDSGADQLITSIQAIGEASAYDTSQLLPMARAWVNIGDNAEAATKKMATIVDAGSAYGLTADKLEAVNVALTQMQMKGKVQAEEMMQLTEAGVPAWNLLADAMQVPVAELQDMASKGQLTQDAMDALFQGMQDKTEGAASSMANTLMGQWSNFEEALTNSMSAVGDIISMAFNVPGVLTELGALAEQVKTVVTSIRDNAQSMGLADAIILELYKVSPAAAEMAAGVQKACDQIKAFFVNAAKDAKDAWEDMKTAIDGVSDAIAENQTAIKNLVVVIGSVYGTIKVWNLMAAAIALVRSGILATKVAQLSLQAAFVASIVVVKIQQMIAAGIALVRGALVAARVAALAFRAACVANPILLALTLIVTAIALVIANWDEVKAAVLSFYAAAKDAIGKLASWITDTIGSAIDKVKGWWDSLVSVFNQGASGTVKVTREVTERSASGSGRGYAQGGVFGMASGGLVGGLVPLANGGQLKHGTPAIVGEAGPEAVIPLKDNVLAKIGNAIMAAYQKGKSAKENTVANIQAKIETIADTGEVNAYTKVLQKAQNQAEEVGKELQGFYAYQEKCNEEAAKYTAIGEETLSYQSKLLSNQKQIADLQARIDAGKGKSGDAEKISLLQQQRESMIASYQKEKQAAIRAAQEAANARTSIEQKAAASIQKIRENAEKEMYARSTALDEARFQQQIANQKMDLESYLSVLNQKDEATGQSYAAILAQETALNEQRQVWADQLMLQAQTWGDYMTTMLTNMGVTIQSSLADGLTNCIMKGESLASVFQSLASTLLSTFIKGVLEKAIANMGILNALSKKNTQQELANKRQEIAAEASKATAAAMTATAALIAANPWSAAGAGALVTGQMGIAAGGAAAIGAGLQVTALASGGIVTDTTLAMVGEGKYDEAVIPLKPGIMNDLYGEKDRGNGEVAPASSNQTVHLTVNALDASGFEDLLDRGGLDKIKQALFSDNRNFATNAGVW